MFTDILVKPFEGSYVNNPVVNPARTHGGEHPDQEGSRRPCSRAWNRTSTWGTEFGYTSTDFFIQVLKKMKQQKMAITPENVQKVASTFTFELKGVKGPIEYPKATVMVYPASSATSTATDEVGHVVPSSCSTKTYSPNLKLG